MERHRSVKNYTIHSSIVSNILMSFEEVHSCTAAKVLFPKETVLLLWHAGQVKHLNRSEHHQLEVYYNFGELNLG